MRVADEPIKPRAAERRIATRHDILCRQAASLVDIAAQYVDDHILCCDTIS